MTTYLRVPIETDPTTLAQDVYDYIRARIPQWQANDASLDVWIIQAIAALAADNRDLAADVPDTIFRYLGASLYGIPPYDSIPASAATTWTMIDTLGHTIPAGTQVAIADSSGNLYAFQVVSDYVVSAGSNATPGGAVTVSAMDPGAAASGLGVTGAVVQLVDVLDFVSQVTLSGSTGGGVDEESDDDYLVRLVRKLRRLSQRPILPVDFSEMAKDADPAVYRSVAIDGYNPSTLTYNNDRTITVASIDINGNAVSSSVKTAIDELLQANREVNFLVYEMDPNYNLINVTTNVKALFGYDPTALQASVVAAIQDYLSPAKWGRDPQFTDTGANETWVDRTTLYYNDLLAAIDRVEGVDRVITMTMAKNPAALGTADVVLTSPASLTQPNAINVTVTP